MNHRPLYTVIEFWTHDKTKKSDIKVMCNGTCINVNLSPENFENAPNIKEQYFQYLEALDAESLDITEEDLYDWALKPLLPLFESIESASESRSTITLYDYFNPITFNYKLNVVDGILAASLNNEKNVEPCQLGITLNFSELLLQYPSFRLSEISICNNDSKDALTQFPGKVLVNQTTICYFKSFSLGVKRDALRELNAYQRVTELGLRNNLRVPRFIGLVQNESNDSYLGLLLSYVDSGRRTLESAIRVDTPRILRQRWINQVTDTLKHLHEASIIWGDAKAANVLIDANMDAWIIDFGGGFTEGWVDKEKAETTEGDLQGLERIVNYIC